MNVHHLLGLPLLVAALLLLLFGCGRGGDDSEAGIELAVERPVVHGPTGLSFPRYLGDGIERRRARPVDPPHHRDHVEVSYTNAARTMAIVVDLYRPDTGGDQPEELAVDGPVMSRLFEHHIDAMQSDSLVSPTSAPPTVTYEPRPQPLVEQPGAPLAWQFRYVVGDRIGYSVQHVYPLSQRGHVVKVAFSFADAGIDPDANARLIDRFLTPLAEQLRGPRPANDAAGPPDAADADHEQTGAQSGEGGS